MDNNRLFSVQSNGYNIGEVDDYVNFIQTELTKNMKLSHDIELQKITLNESIKKLENENRILNNKNQKLYRDCVSFAKRLKALEVYDSSPELEQSSDIEALRMLEEYKESYALLLEENKELKSRLFDIQNANTTLDVFQVIDDTVNDEDNNSDSEYDNYEIEQFSAEEEIFSGEALKDKPENKIFEEKNDYIPFQSESSEFIEDEVLIFEENQIIDSLKEELNEINNNSVDNITNSVSSKTGKNYLRGFFNFIVTLLLIISIITSVVSIFSYIFLRVPNLNLFGYRAYTVQNENDNLGFSKNDILIADTKDISSVKKNNIILCVDSKTNSRSIKLVSSIKSDNSDIKLNVKDFSDDTDIKTIDISSLVGIIATKIPYLGIITNYAFSSPYDYIAVMACILLLSIFFKIIIYLDVSKERKKKFQGYDMSDFSLEI